ncbi:DUF1542 domain-containing protein, partial [Streptococcus pseudopneumoniae]
MGSGAVSAAEAQTIQSNEEVAADKDSETEKKSEDPQLTYAAPAAKEQGSATNTEAGDEDSVSGDSSSPKSEGEGTRSEEASSKPKVRKRREADPAPPATAADDDLDANQVYTAPVDDASVEDLATKLKALPETVENEKKLANIDQVGATKSINPGEVSELDEFGGWKAVSADGNKGKFAIARKTEEGVYPIDTVNVTRSGSGANRKYVVHVEENTFDRSNAYALFLSKVRTYATKNEETFDGQPFKDVDTNGGNGEPTKISRGIKGFNGIEKTYKAYSSSTGTGVNISFKTGFTGDIDGVKAGYKVEVIAKFEDGTTRIIYSQNFLPTDSKKDATKQVVAVDANDGVKFEVKTSTNPTTYTLNKQLAMYKDRQMNKTGNFTSKTIDLPKGAIEYTVQISASDNSKLGMGYQVTWNHYALPIVGTGFSVTQDTRKVAKDLSEKVYHKLTESKAEDTKWSTPETKAAYEAKLQEIKDKLASEDSTTSNYKDVVRDALEKRKTLNEELKIKHKAADEIAEKAAEKLVMIDDDDTLSENEKDAAKEEVIENAKKAANKVKVATDQASVEKAKMEGIDAITKVTPVGRDNAKAEVAKKLADKLAEIDNTPNATKEEKDAAKEQAKAAARKADADIDAATDNAGVEQAKTDGTTAVEAVSPTVAVKDAAKAEVAKKLADKLAEIDNTPNATKEEKDAAKEQAKAAARKADADIDAATDNAGVEQAKTDGTTAVEAVSPTVAVKDAAKAEVAKKLADKLAEIDNTPNATKEEKDAAKKQAKAAADEAIQAIDAASDQAGVDKAQADGIAAVAAVNPVAKDKAKEAVAAKLKEKEAEIDANANLSDAEKDAAKKQAKAAADEAIQA